MIVCWRMNCHSSAVSGSVFPRMLSGIASLPMSCRLLRVAARRRSAVRPRLWPTCCARLDDFGDVMAEIGVSLGDHLQERVGCCRGALRREEVLCAYMR